MIQRDENRDAAKLDSSHLLLFVFSKLRIFIIVGIVTLIISAGVSLVIEEKF